MTDDTMTNTGLTGDQCGYVAEAAPLGKDTIENWLLLPLRAITIASRYR